MKREWVVSIHRKCRAAKVPFFSKQWGGVRKDLTGRNLFGRTYDHMPSVQPSHVPAPQLELTLA